MFRADTVAEGFGMIKTMFTGFTFGINSVSYIAELLSPYYIFILILAVAFAYPVRENLLSYVDGRSVKAKYTINTVVYAFDILLVLLCVINLATATYNPFIYFRF